MQPLLFVCIVAHYFIIVGMLNHYVVSFVPSSGSNPFEEGRNVYMTLADC